MVEEKTIDLFARVKEALPKDAHISDIKYEGCEIVLYTKSKDFFLDNSNAIKDIVIKLKKRIILRPDPSLCLDMEKAKIIIEKIVPKEAGLKDVTFEPAFGRVIIEADKPGLVIGKGGETLREIKKQTVWFPVIKRASAIPSDVVKVLRKIIYEEDDFRKEFLNNVGKNIHSGWKETKWIRLTALGGFREVGRSCILVQTPESRVLLDCGIKPGSNEFAYLDAPEFDIKSLNAIVLSHAHMDHCLHPDSYIQMSSGEITSIKDVITGYNVPAINFGNNFEIDNISAVQRGAVSAPDKLFEIRTMTKRLKVTDEHPFFAIRNNKLKIVKSKDLEKNDFIATIRCMPIIGKNQKLPESKNLPKKMDKSIFQILGYIVGDGNKDNNSVRCTDKDIDNLKLYEKLFKKYNLNPHIKINNRNRLLVHSKEFVRWLDEIDPNMLSKSLHRRVPSLICKSKIESIAMFLKGIYDAEGSVRNHAISLSTSSENIAHVTQMLLSRFGIISHIYDVDESISTFGGNDGYQIVISDPASLFIFKNKIGFGSRNKQKNFTAMLKKIGKGKAKKIDLVPLTSEVFLEIASKLGLKKIDIRKLGFNYNHYKEHYPSIDKVKEFVRKIESSFPDKIKSIEEFEFLKKICSSDILWEPIRDIRIIKSDTKYVYDLTVPGHSNYIANGIIVHNCGAIPLLYKMGYEGPLYCTLPTRDLMVLLCMDYLEIMQREGGNIAYSTKDIKEAVKHTICLEYDEVSDITPDIRLTLMNSGHILGGSLCHLHVGNGLHNILYTGDIKFDRTALFEPASFNFQRAETVITESTYGSAEDIQPKRDDTEAALIEIANRTIKRGGKLLIPSFAVERSQDLMVILHKYGFKNTVYLDGMVWDATAIHTTYPEYFNRDLQKQILQKDDSPFTNKMFKRIGSSEERKKILESDEPCVIIATSGMLVAGPSVWWLKNLAEDKNNTLLFVGYQGEGTMGRRIQKGWKEIPMEENGRNRTVPINCEIATITGLSGHSDVKQLINYLSRLNQRPERIIVDHGEASKCIEFARIAHNAFRCETLAPKNLESIRLK